MTPRPDETTEALVRSRDYWRMKANALAARLTETEAQRDDYWLVPKLRDRAEAAERRNTELEAALRGYYDEHNHFQPDADPDEAWLTCVCGNCSAYRALATQNTKEAYDEYARDPVLDKLEDEQFQHDYRMGTTPDE